MVAEEVRKLADGSAKLVDPFAAGRLITVDEAHARMQEMLGPDVEWSDELLQPDLGGLAVAMLRAVLRRHHRDRPVDQPVAQVMCDEILLRLGQGVGRRRRPAQLDAGVRRVDMLPARTRGPVSVDADIRGRNVDPRAVLAGGAGA